MRRTSGFVPTAGTIYHQALAVCRDCLCAGIPHTDEGVECVEILRRLVAEGPSCPPFVISSLTDGWPLGAIGESKTSTNSREPEVVWHRQILLAERFRAIFVFTDTDSRMRKHLPLIDRGKRIGGSYLLIQLALREWAGTMPQRIRIVMKRWLCQISCLSLPVSDEYRGEVAFRTQIIAQVILLQMVTAIRSGAVLALPVSFQMYLQRACSDSAGAGMFEGEGMMTSRQN